MKENTIVKSNPRDNQKRNELAGEYHALLVQLSRRWKFDYWSGAIYERGLLAFLKGLGGADPAIAYISPNSYWFGRNKNRSVDLSKPEIITISTYERHLKLVMKYEKELLHFAKAISLETGKSVDLEMPNEVLHIYPSMEK